MLGETLALITALCWAISANLYKKGMEKADFITLNLVRSLAAAIFLSLLALASGEMKEVVAIKPETLTILVLSSLIGFGLGDSLYLIALKYAGVSRSVPIASSYPLFTIPLAHILLGEELTPMVVIGAIMVAAGIVLICRGFSVEGPKDREGRKIGISSSILAAVVWAISITLAAASLAFINPTAASLIRVNAITLFLLTLTITLKRMRLILAASLKDLLLISSAGVIALGLGGVIFMESLKLAGAAKAVPLSSLTPLFASFIAITFLKEKVTPSILIGTILAVAGSSAIFIG